LVVLLVILFFLFFVGSLLVFHSVLASQNLTTWESVSWHKITYLKGTLNGVGHFRYPEIDGVTIFAWRCCKFATLLPNPDSEDHPLGVQSESTPIL
jgi:hypothetical protein